MIVNSTCMWLKLAAIRTMSSSTIAAKMPLTHCDNMNKIHSWHAWRASESFITVQCTSSQSHFCWRDWACPWRRHIAPVWTKIDFSSQLEVHLNWYTGFSLIFFSTRSWICKLLPGRSVLHMGLCRVRMVKVDGSCAHTRLRFALWPHIREAKPVPKKKFAQRGQRG